MLREILGDPELGLVDPSDSHFTRCIDRSKWHELTDAELGAVAVLGDAGHPSRPV